MSEQEKPPELKPCPFCGVQPWRGEFPRRDVSSERHEIACEHPDCPIRVEVYAGSKAEAVAKWNTRADIASTGMWDEAIRIVSQTWLSVSVGKVKPEHQSEYERNKVIAALEAARDAALEPKGTKP